MAGRSVGWFTDWLGDLLANPIGDGVGVWVIGRVVPRCLWKQTVQEENTQELINYSEEQPIMSASLCQFRPLEVQTATYRNGKIMVRLVESAIYQRTKGTKWKGYDYRSDFSAAKGKPG